MRTKANRLPSLPIPLVFAAAAIAVGCSVSRQGSVTALRTDVATKPDDGNNPKGFPIGHCAAVLEQFRDRQLPGLEQATAGKTNILGAGCIDTGSGSLEIIVVGDTPPDEKIPDFPYDDGKGGKADERFPVRWTEGTAGRVACASNPALNGPPQGPAGAPASRAANPPPIYCGTSAQGDRVAKEGTAGLNIIFNRTAVCIGNAHVMVLKKSPAAPGMPSTPPAAAVTLGGDAGAGTLFGYKPVTFADADPNALNVWDLALAKYLSPAQALGQMRPCPKMTYCYPAGFAASGSVSTGQGAHYTGAASCADDLGLVLGAFFPVVQMPENNVNKTVKFATQILFSNTTLDRDSGAVIVRNSDNCVLGLHAGDCTYTDQQGHAKHGNYANPLYRAPWTVDSDATIPNPNHLLMFKAAQGHDLPYPDLFDNTLKSW
jgi:hypothetical protein